MKIMRFRSSHGRDRIIIVVLTLGNHRVSYFTIANTEMDF